MAGFNHDAAASADEPCLVSVACLRKLCDPFENPPWDGVAGLTLDGVRQAMQEGFVLAQAYSGERRRTEWSTEDHIARIAYLAQEGWDKPIDVDVGVPSLGCHVEWPVIDGNHRLAAAIVRGDEYILAKVSGCSDTMIHLLVQMPLPTAWP